MSPSLLMWAEEVGLAGGGAGGTAGPPGGANNSQVLGERQAPGTRRDLAELLQESRVFALLQVQGGWPTTPLCGITVGKPESQGCQI